MAARVAIHDWQAFAKSIVMSEKIVKTTRKIFVRNFARRAIFLRRSVSSRIGNSLSKLILVTFLLEISES